MTLMAIPEGDLDPKAARIIQLIEDYARQEPAPDKAVNCLRARGLIRLKLAADRALPIGLALLNHGARDGVPGRLSLRDLRDRVPMRAGTPKANVDRGKVLLAEEAS